MSSTDGSSNTGAGSAKQKASKSVSRSAKAGLQFPVGRVARWLKNGKYAERVGAGAPVYLSAVLEYLSAESVWNSDVSRSEVMSELQCARC
ncbi:Histone H2AX [Capsicum baccatum]|uniref:Histone H2A n=1 Tax=Capsicum baccatum TaxID=33114 RepID=A0A2G2WWB0_CAPBA|nr:Histone H2AX [Capsicum baccatum]